MSTPKALLEKKMFLAKITPEPIFDLTDCNIKCIPPGVYIGCKVYRKECLLLQNNRLKNLDGGGQLSDLTLIRVLDVRNNQLISLSRDIKHLVNLEVLRLDGNMLETLPNEIGFLHKLEILSLQNNKLYALPDCFDKLSNLRCLDVRGNEKVKRLPFSLCHAIQLDELLVDLNREWEMPPSAVLDNGVKETLTFLAKSAGIEITTTVAVTTEQSNTTSRSSLNEYLASYDETIQDRLQDITKRREEKSQFQLKAQEYLLSKAEQEAILFQKSESAKQKLITELTADREELDEMIRRCQKYQDTGRKEFYKHLQSVEDTADKVVQQVLLANKKRNFDTDVDLSDLLDGHASLQKDYQRQAVLQCMEDLLQNECHLKNKFKENDELRKDIVDNIYHEEKEWENKIYDLLITKKEQRNQFLDELSNDTNLQYAAVATLLEKTDTRSIALKTEVLMIENQLSNLTVLELEKKRNGLNNSIKQLAEKRSRLTDLLLDLFNQQEERRKELTKLLLEMEVQQTDKNEYWLSQYQNLMDKNSFLVKDWYHAVKPELTYHMAVLGVVHCLPFLNKCDAGSIKSLQEITDSKLKESGIKSTEDRQNVLKAINLYLQGKDDTDEPSAPPLSDFPSAPELSEVESLNLSFDLLNNECVICMDEESIITFLPCGHLCCCIGCAVSTDRCPLCRSDITNKIQKSDFL